MMTTKRFSRRAFLQGAGAVTVMAVGGVAYRAVDQGVFSAGTGPAYEAWQTWDADSAAGPLALVRAGILAASPHNTQPWLFEVVPDEITVYADTRRHLGLMDPYFREMYIGLGCAIENMVLAGAAEGYAVAVELAEGELSETLGAQTRLPVARLTLTQALAETTSLYDAIPRRRTNRYPYAATPLAAATLTELTALNPDPELRLFLFSKPEDSFERLAAMNIAATEQIIADHAMAYDSFRWIRQSWQDVQTYKDGPYIDTAGVPAPIRAVAKLTPPMSQAAMDAGWLDGETANMAATPAIALLAVRKLYDQAQALRAGRLWQRLHLWATTRNLAVQPINQMPELVDRQRQLGQDPVMARFFDALSGDEGWRPTFVFRLGHPTSDPLPSARRPATEVLL